MAEKESKKRKKQSNGNDSSNKRVAFEDATTSGPVKVTFNDASALNPILVSSPGLTAPSIPFKAYTKPLSTRHSNEETPKPSTHSLLLHSSKHPRLDYTASGITLDQNLSHYVAVFDPETRQLQITPAHHLSLRSSLRTEDDSPQKTPRRTIGQQRDALGREFGTNKAKKAIAAKAVNAITGKDATPGKGKKDGVQSAILDSIASATAPTTPQGEETAEAALASKPIPKPNLAAESVEAVYTFNTLIPPQDARLVSIKDWQDKTRDDVKIDFHHRFPAFRVQRIGKSEDVHRLKALRYLSLLLEFHDALQNAGKSGKKVPKKDILMKKLASWSEALVSSVRVRFSNQSNELPKWHLQKLYTHMCALSLFVDGWATDTTNLKDDLRLEQKEITQYFRELGCRVGPPSDKEKEQMQQTGMKKEAVKAARFAKLRLPLEFPKARSVGRRR